MQRRAGPSAFARNRDVNPVPLSSALKYGDVMPSGPEWIIVLAIVLLIFGGSQVPKLARNLGKAQREFKQGIAEGQQAESP